MRNSELRSSSKDIYHLLMVVVVVVAICALYFARVVFMPLALAMLFAFTLTPLAKLFERLRFGKIASAWLVVLIGLAAVVGIGWMVVNQFSEVVNQLPEYQSNIADKIDSLHFLKSDAVRNASATVDEISKALATPAGTPDAPSTGKRPPRARQPLPVQVIQPVTLPIESVQSALRLLLSSAIVIIFTIFMLVRREGLRNRFISLVGQHRMSVMTRALDEAGERVSRYLRTQLAVNAAYGAFIGIGLHLIGIPGGLLWGVIVGLLRFLPYIGPPLGAIMPLMLSLAIFPGWHGPLITLGLFVVTELVVANAIEPLLYGAHTGISPLAILVAAIFWTAVWGPIGLVLSTPLTVCLVVLGRHIPNLAFLPLLLGEEPVIAADARIYQRLLAMNHEDAEQVLELLLETKSLEEVYDTVLIPVLGLAEQDRHSHRLDEASEKFIFQSLREIVDHLFERCSQSVAARAETEPETTNLRADCAKVCKVLCVPARDEADEIIAIMLAQLLTRAGYTTLSLPLGAAGEMAERAARENPDVVCISALPPFMVSHSRALYKSMRALLPNVEVVVGLWNFPGDMTKMVARMGLADGCHPVTGLVGVIQAIRESKRFANATPVIAPISADIRQ